MINVITTVYTKNQLVSWSDDKELLSVANAIDWNSFKKKKKMNHLKINKKD